MAADRNIKLGEEQFELLSQSLNACMRKAKKTGNSYEIERIAYDFLEPMDKVYRRLVHPENPSLTVDQYLYTNLQEHDIWMRESFWFGVFEKNVQDRICQIAIPDLEEFRIIQSDETPTLDKIKNDQHHPLIDLSGYTKFDSRYAMAIVAESLRNQQLETKDNNMREEMELIHAEATKLSLLMVQVLWPFDTKRFGNVLAKGKNLLFRNFQDQARVGTLGYTNTMQSSDHGSDLRSVIGGATKKDKRVEAVGANIAQVVTNCISDLCTISRLKSEQTRKLTESINMH